MCYLQWYQAVAAIFFFSPLFNIWQTCATQPCGEWVTDGYLFTWESAKVLGEVMEVKQENCSAKIRGNRCRARTQQIRSVTWTLRYLADFLHVTTRLWVKMFHFDLVSFKSNWFDPVSLQSNRTMPQNKPGFHSSRGFESLQVWHFVWRHDVRYFSVSNWTWEREVPYFTNYRVKSFKI